MLFTPEFQPVLESQEDAGRCPLFRLEVEQIDAVQHRFSVDLIALTAGQRGECARPSRSGP